MEKIIPHLWFDKEAVEASKFYCSIFPDSKVTHAGKVTGTPSGDCDIVSFELHGQPFMAISAGPYFKFNPAISFMVNFDPSKDKNAAKNIDATWAKLSEGGMVLMELGKYPYSERYGWIQDKFGLSWQLILTNPDGEERPHIIPTLLFVGKSYGKAEAAIKHYRSVFSDSQMGAMHLYGPGQVAKEGTVMFADFRLRNIWMAAMDGPGEHVFGFNEAISFIVQCDTQAEIDAYSDKLSALPEAEQCGWLKDKFGISWQIAPKAMDAMMQCGDQAKIDRVTQAFLPMKRFDIKKLEKAFQG